MRFHAMVLAGTLSLTACAVGPRYVRPSAPVPSAFKEAPPAGWKTAEPQDLGRRGSWWEVFHDPDLNALEEQLDASSQDLAKAAAVFREARAAAHGARADLFPTVTLGATVTKTRGTPPLYQVPLDLSWEADVFGRIRRNLEANVATAQASAADLEAVRLSLHAELATDWFLLHGLDAQKSLLDTVEAAYTRALQLTRNRHDQGVASGVDVAQAETQLETTRVAVADLEVERSQLEHAIAILIGKPPAELAIPASQTASTPPAIPGELPTELLERRPDIAAAERRIAAANAQVGVAMAGFFPRFLLAASAGFEHGMLQGLASLPSRFWSVGPSLVETLFSGGKRRAAIDQAQASYDAAVADYRQSVLAALQEVEDGLAENRILAEESDQEARAVAAAERLVTLAQSRYEGGITTYLEVVIAQAAALTNERAAVDLLTRRMTACVALVKALGGGWQASAVPSADAVLSRTLTPPAYPAPGRTASGARPGDPGTRSWPR